MHLIVLRKEEKSMDIYGEKNKWHIVVLFIDHRNVNYLCQGDWNNPILSQTLDFGHMQHKMLTKKWWNTDVSDPIHISIMWALPLVPEKPLDYKASLLYSKASESIVCKYILLLFFAKVPYREPLPTWLYQLQLQKNKIKMESTVCLFLFFAAVVVAEISHKMRSDPHLSHNPKITAKVR